MTSLHVLRWSLLTSTRPGSQPGTATASRSTNQALQKWSRRPWDATCSSAQTSRSTAQRQTSSSSGAYATCSRSTVLMCQCAAGRQVSAMYWSLLTNGCPDDALFTSAASTRPRRRAAWAPARQQTSHTGALSVSSHVMQMHALAVHGSYGAATIDRAPADRLRGCDSMSTLPWSAPPCFDLTAGRAPPA